MSFNFSGQIVGQMLTLDQSMIVEGTNEYLTAEFTFDEEWNGMSIWLHADLGNQHWKINLHDGKVLRSDRFSPDSGTWEICCHGTASNGMRITTNPVDLKIRRTNIDPDAPLPEIAPTPAEQIDQKAQDALNKAQSVVDRANAGEFKGDSGPAGVSPHIGENGNWYVGDTDTGVYAGGEAPYIGTNGHWYVGNTDTGVSATGPQGDRGFVGQTGDDGPAGPAGADGGHYTPSASADGNAIHWDPSKDDMPAVPDIPIPGGGEQYTLPVASATKLGGIKADPAEAGDTQPVRIGTDGKLVTAKGGGGGNEWHLIGTYTIDNSVSGRVIIDFTDMPESEFYITGTIPQIEGKTLYAGVGSIVPILANISQHPYSYFAYMFKSIDGAMLGYEGASHGWANGWFIEPLMESPRGNKPETFRMSIEPFAYNAQTGQISLYGR